MRPEDFTQQYAPNGELTAQQAAQLLELVDQGDTGTLPEEGSAPDAAPAVNQDAAAADAATEVNTDVADPGADQEVDPAKAVILAKDGIHTISYDKLVEAREGRRTAETQAQEALARLQEAQTELSALKEQAQQRADAGMAATSTDKNIAAAEAAIDAGVDPELFGDFSEEALAKGVRKLISMDLPTLVEQLVEKKLAPLQQKQALSEQDAHANAVLAAHPDIESVIGSRELDAWIDAQPKFAQPGYRAVLSNGTSEAVIELMDTFKAATGKAQAAAPSEQDVRTAAKKAIEAVKAPVPVSLSDIPGGRPGASTVAEAMANLNAIDRAEAMQNWTPEQIEAYLNRSA